MKKILLLIGISLFVVGCQEKESKRESIETSRTYTIESKLEFEIEKTQVIDCISPSNKNNDYRYIEAKEGYQFIDIIIKTKNLTKQELSIKDIYSGTFRIDKQSYGAKLAIEAENYTQISETDSLKSNQDRYIHVYCEVADTLIEMDVTLELNVNKNKQYQYFFQTEKIVIDNDIKSVGDVLVFKQAQIELKKMTEAKKVEPSNKGFFYSYIPVDNQDETFIILELDVKNLTNQSLTPSDYIYCEYKVGENIIKSKVIIESDNHQSLSKTGSIGTGQIRTVYLTMSVKDSLLNLKSQVELFVEGDTIIIQK